MTYSYPLLTDPGFDPSILESRIFYTLGIMPLSISTTSAATSAQGTIDIAFSVALSTANKTNLDNLMAIQTSGTAPSTTEFPYQVEGDFSITGLFALLKTVLASLNAFIYFPGDKTRILFTRNLSPVELSTLQTSLGQNFKQV